MKLITDTTISKTPTAVTPTVITFQNAAAVIIAIIKITKILTIFKLVFIFSVIIQNINYPYNFVVITSNKVPSVRGAIILMTAPCFIFLKHGLYP